MKSNFLAMLALAFLFAFVFSLAMTFAVDLKAKDPYFCGGCCYIPAKVRCTAGWGRLIDNKCDCRIIICPAIDPPCRYVCPVCG